MFAVIFLYFPPCTLARNDSLVYIFSTSIDELFLAEINSSHIFHQREMIRWSTLKRYRIGGDSIVWTSLRHRIVYLHRKLKNINIKNCLKYYCFLCQKLLEIELISIISRNRARLILESMLDFDPFSMIKFRYHFDTLSTSYFALDNVLVL